MHVRNKKSEISSLYMLYLLLCGFFSCSAFSFLSPQQIRNREFLFHITASLRLLFFAFPSLLPRDHETSNSSMLCQLHAAAKPSTAFDVRVIVSNRGATEQIELGESQQRRMKNTPIHDLFIRGSEIDTFGCRTQQNCVQTQRDGVHTP